LPIEMELSKYKSKRFESAYSEFVNTLVNAERALSRLTTIAKNIVPSSMAYMKKREAAIIKKMEDVRDNVSTMLERALT